MNGPKRLFESSDSPVVRRMLTSAQREEPGDHALQSTLAALGIGAAAASVSSVAGTATAAAATQSTAVSGTMVAAGGTVAGSAPGSAGALGGAGAGAKVAGTGVMATVTKLTAAGVAGGLLTFGVLGQVLDSPSERPPAPSESALPSAVERSAEVVLPAPAPVPPEETEPEVVEEPKPVARIAPRKAAVTHELEPSALEREVALIDAARAAVAKGEGARALTILADYSHQFPRGRLAPEAEYLRMQARSASGDTQGARTAARELLERHPSGPHSARARALLESSEKPSKD